jgi:uncharacterized YigZ family protein
MDKIMNEKDFYSTVGGTAQATYSDRGSKFIAYAFPIKSSEEFKQRLNEVKKDHPKATHHCFAYRLGIDNNTYRSSDAGEPSGTAGKPILGQIDSKELTDTLIVVVRYFGGSLLGVPGLINAYKSAASMVLQLAPILQKQVSIMRQIQFDYTQLNDVMRIVKQLGIEVVKQDVQLFSRFTLSVAKNKMEQFEYHMKNLPGVELENDKAVSHKDTKNS